MRATSDNIKLEGACEVCTQVFMTPVVHWHEESAHVKVRVFTPQTDPFVIKGMMAVDVSWDFVCADCRKRVGRTLMNEIEAIRAEKILQRHSAEVEAQ